MSCLYSTDCTRGYYYKHQLSILNPANVLLCCARRRDGTAPGDPIKTDLQQAMFTAGELAALLSGQRGIALVQLWNGWDASKGQPLYNPCAIAMLERVLAAPGVACCSSMAPGGEQLKSEG
jgi:hypothetical protein